MHTSGGRRRLRLITLASLFAPGWLFSQEPTRIPARSPIVLFGNRVNIVVASPRALAQATDSLSVARALESCTAAIRGASAAAYANEPTGVQGASRDDRVVFVVVPAPSSSICGDASAHWNPALLARGVQIAAPSAFEARNVRTVEVSARGQVVPLDSSARRAVVTIPESSAQTVDQPSQIATWISAKYLAPDATGRLPEVTLHVATSDSSPPDIVTLEGDALRDVWQDLIVARIEKLGNAPTIRAPMHVPLPSDKRLREAHVLYSAGQVAAAARIAEQRLAAERLSAEDARAARMLIVGALLAYDDTSAARVVLRDVLADAPCLTLSGSQAVAERLIDAMRPRTRCSVTPLRRILLASLVPGMGHAVIGNPGAAVLAGGLTGAGAVAAWVSASNGDQAYRRYLDARSTGDAMIAYGDATRSRRAARVALRYAATAWALAGTTAVLAEHMHARSVARVHDYDIQPTVGLLPDVHGGEARLSMSVTW